MSKFWMYRQNNSGGRFMVDDKVAHFVIVEAHNMKQANALAESYGLYFDGAGDCHCCGNRWSEQWDEEDGTELPMIYGEPAKEFKKTGAWWQEEAVIYYLDGNKDRFDIQTEDK